MYRELILNSEAFFKGDKNHPQFIFPEDITLKKFCVRNVQLPNFNNNFPVTQEKVRLEYKTVATGDVWQAAGVVNIDGPANFPTVAVLGAFFSTVIQASLFPIFGVVTTSVQLTESFFLIPDNAFPAVITGWRIVFDAVDFLKPAKYFRRLMGSNPLNAASVTYPAANYVIGALKMTQNNYLLLKSNAMSGATFTPNGTRTGNSQSASVLAKIPIDFSTSAYGNYIFYSVNDSPSSETMFSYNGGKINMFDLYFTRPYDDDVVDFQGFNFSITLGILTNDVI